MTMTKQKATLSQQRKIVILGLVLLIHRNDIRSLSAIVPCHATRPTPLTSTATTFAFQLGRHDSYGAKKPNNYDPFTVSQNNNHHSCYSTCLSAMDDDDDDDDDDGPKDLASSALTAPSYSSSPSSSSVSDSSSSSSVRGLLEEYGTQQDEKGSRMRKPRIFERIKSSFKIYRVFSRRRVDDSNLNDASKSAAKDPSTEATMSTNTKAKRKQTRSKEQRRRQHQTEPNKLELKSFYPEGHRGQEHEGSRDSVVVQNVIAIKAGGGDRGGGPHIPYPPVRGDNSGQYAQQSSQPQQRYQQSYVPPQQRQVTMGSQEGDQKNRLSGSNGEVRSATASRQYYMDSFAPPKPPPRAPNLLPLRFLRAGKGDVEEGIRRYKATLAWRHENHVDTILREPNPFFGLIKRHYPHFFHGRGYNGEPCFYEQPPKTNLPAIQQGITNYVAGATAGHPPPDDTSLLTRLLRHYTMLTEFQWQYLVRDDLMRSIYIIDMEGLRFRDFVGDVVEYVKKATALSAEHYPERAGVVYVINVPAWFHMIWRVVKPWIDEATLKKIFILRNKDEIRRCMQEKIPLEQLPREYGGQSPYPLGRSPEEQEFARLVAHNNRLAAGDYSCGGTAPGSTCRFCNWVPPRSY